MQTFMSNDQQKNNNTCPGRTETGEGMEALPWQRPADLLQLLVVTAAIAMLVIITLSTFGFYRIFSRFVIDSAEEDAVDLCQVMIEEYRPFFFRVEASPDMNRAADEIAYQRIDQGLRRFLKPYQILKIKVYNTDRKIVYSTDSGIIGRVDKDNPRLAIALSGKVSSRLETKDKMRDLAEEEVINLDVIETYVPIKDRFGKLQGSFEIYLKMNKYRDQVWHGVFVTIGILIVVVIGVFSIAYILVKKVADRLVMFQEHLQKIAATDSLTGVYNRGYLFKLGGEQFQRVQRNRKKNLPHVNLGCLMIDIDFFKSINDTKGHLSGDLVINGVSDRIRTGLRNYDLLCRFGGEEFVVLLPDTDFETSRLVAGRILDAIRNDPFDVAGESIMVTVSIGISSYDDNDANLNDILKRSDEALYKAKEGGRDRMEWV
jgi:diguanylate cyclase